MRVAAIVFFRYFSLTIRNKIERSLTFHIQETSNMFKMMALFMLVILTKSTFVTMDIVRSTGYVGKKIYMRCFDQPDQVFQPIRAVIWTSLFHDDCTDTSTYVTVADCDQGSSDYVLNGYKLIANDTGSTCGNGLEFMGATEPGNFTYKCQGMSEDSSHVIREVTFMITIHALDNSPISPCLAKKVPSSQNLIFDFICKNYRQRDCLNDEEWENVIFLQHNDVRIIPDITSSNKIVARIGLENISSISQYYCINQNHSSSCVVDNVALSNSIGITPIVNRVIEGGDAIFECNFKDGHERGVKYEWSLSRQIDFSRTDLGLSGISYSTVKISDVKSEDDGVVVMCEVNVNETSFYSEAFLKILSGHNTSTSSTELGNSRTSLKTDDANFTTDDATTITFDSSAITSTNATPHTPLGLFAVFAAIFICVMCILVVVAANPKTRRRCRRLINKDSNVQGAIGLTRLESNVRSVHSPTAHSPTPRRPSAAALPLPLTPSPEESSELCPGAIFGGPESSHQQKDYPEAMPSPRSNCQSSHLSALLTSAPKCYHVYYGLEEEHHPLSTSSFGATLMPKYPIKSKSSSTKTHKSGKSSTTQTLPPYEINRSVSLPSKKTSQHSCTGSPLISLTRKGSANDQPLPPIPKSPGSYDEQDTITESCLSKELPVAVIKPMIHGYASIKDDQQFHGDERLSMPDASGLHSPSATTTTSNANEGYTEYTYGNEKLRKIIGDGEIESSSRSSSLIPECHTYAVAGNDADEKIAGTCVSAQSIYHTIDEEKSGTLLSAGRQHVQHADDATSANRDSVSSNRHIYEMPVDDIAPEVNNQSNSTETTFYFTLESEKDGQSRDVIVEQSAGYDPTARLPEQRMKSVIKESEQNAIKDRKEKVERKDEQLRNDLGR